MNKSYPGCHQDSFGDIKVFIIMIFEVHVQFNKCIIAYMLRTDVYRSREGPICSETFRYHTNLYRYCIDR